MQMPALIMAHNKTLAAQLYAEFKEFFPENAVEYFVSYYDYYQPEAYVPRHDLYIEKETEINEQIERMRLAATTSLVSRRDVIIVASVSCIYGLGNPEEFGKSTVIDEGRGDLSPQCAAADGWSKSQYQRNDLELRPGTSACAATRWRSSRRMRTGAASASRSLAMRSSVSSEFNPLTGEIYAGAERGHPSIRRSITLPRATN